MKAAKLCTGWVTLGLLVATGISCSPSASSPGGSDAEVKLQGAGASFPAPLYNKWFKTYSAAHPGVIIDYQSVGSGNGVKAVIDKTVDFGASDAAMSADEMKQVAAGVQLLPMTAGSIVLAYNLPGVDELKLSREVYVGIFLGKITNWNDPKIAASNPGAKLPDQTIKVIVRSDSSGTTFVFTKHLSAISEEFAKSPGTSKMPNWPVGTKSKGNEGVAASLKTTQGAIGYIEFGYAHGAKLAMAQLQNKAGKFVAPSIESGQAAVASAKFPENLIAWVSDPEGDASYPIDTFTWMIFYQKYDSAEKVKAVKDVVNYCLTEGQKESATLGYVPLPAVVVEKVKAALDNIHGPATSEKGT
jgi:phosphate transport system substrate-binding protein